MGLGSLVKSSVGQLAEALGYRIIDTSRVMPRDVASHLRILLDHVKVSCVLDVGANVGQFGRMLRDEVGYKGLIVSFEPGSAALEQLRRAAADDPAWIVRPYAIGAEAGRLSFNVMKADTLSSFLPPERSATELFAEHNVVDHVEEVEVKRLDAAVAELRRECDPGEAMFLKMDTQGYELQVLAGAGAVLAEMAGVQVELPFLPLYHDMPSYVTILAALDEHGFQLSGFFPVSQDSGPRIIEADCVMVNPSRLAGSELRLMWTNEA